MQHLRQLLEDLEMSWTMALVGAAIGIALTAAAYWAALYLVVRIPADYFSEERRRRLRRQHPLRRWSMTIAKNLAGVFVVILGAALTLPGVPGPGLLLIAIGVLLIDFPGKRRLEQRFIGHPRVLRAINGHRLRAGTPPLVMNPDEKSNA